MKSKKRYSHFLLLLTLASCSLGEVKQQDLDQQPSYRTSGVEQFFLPELPAWANYSIAGECYKSDSFQYMDFPKLVLNYKLNYEQMVELQAQYNIRRQTYFSTTAVKFLKPVEEASFFSNTLEQVRGGVKQFKIPAVPEVDVIWLEAYQQSKKVEELKKMATSGRFEQRLPVIFSSCMSNQRLHRWIQENGLGDAGLYLLSAEWLSPYGPTNELHAGLRVHLSKIFSPGTKVHYLLPDKSLSPIELVQ
jgi:hypothetical protein